VVVPQFHTVSVSVPGKPNARVLIDRVRGRETEAVEKARFLLAARIHALQDAGPATEWCARVVATQDVEDLPVKRTP
jgi:hypothetical protein